MATVTPASRLTGKAIEAAVNQRVLAFACRVLVRSGIDASATERASTHERKPGSTWRPGALTSSQRG